MAHEFDDRSAASLKAFFLSQTLVYVGSNMMLYYVPGNKRRHVAPDIFIVKGVPNQVRPFYLLWEERKGPDFIIEITSSSTRKEDEGKKFQLYQDTLRVKEYYLFDPDGDYLDPPLKGYRLRRGEYQPIRPVHGRLPSQVTGLHLERHGRELRLYDPGAQRWLPTPAEALAQSEARTLQEMLRIQLEQRFGPLSQDQFRRLDEADLVQLKAAVTKVLTITSPDELWL